MNILVLGVGDAFSARHYSAAFALEFEGAWLLVDCPHPIRKMAAEASAKSGVLFEPGSAEGLLLTHLHADHASGVEGLGFFRHFVVGGKLPLLTAPEVAADLWEGHLRAGMSALIRSQDGPPQPCQLSDFFDVRELTPSARIGPFEIELRPTRHHIPTFALRVRAGGRTVAYSADAAWDIDQFDWLSKADLIIHEANVGPAHTAIEHLVALPASTRQRLRIIGFPDALDVKGAGLKPLHEGEWLPV